MVHDEVAPNGQRPSRWHRLPALLCLVLAIAALWPSARLVRDDLAFSAVNTELSFWGRGTYRPDAATMSRTGHRIDALLAAHPQHPDYLAARARYAAWRAYWADKLEVNELWGEIARDAQYASLASRPSVRGDWAVLEDYARRTSGGESLAREAASRVDLLSGSGKATRQEVD